MGRDSGVRVGHDPQLPVGGGPVGGVARVVAHVAVSLGVRKSHCHVFLGGLDPGQAPLKTLLLMLRLT